MRSAGARCLPCIGRLSVCRVCCVLSVRFVKRGSWFSTVWLPRCVGACVSDFVSPWHPVPSAWLSVCHRASVVASVVAEVRAALRRSIPIHLSHANVTQM